jgi:5'(3')-deoxyribonucleotidase
LVKGGIDIERKSVGIDLDSTLNCLDKRWIEEEYNRDYNDNLTREDMVRWDVSTYVKPECGQKIYDYLLKPKFFRNLEIQPHAQKVTKFLSQYYDLYIVTAYHYKVCEDKAEWLIEHFPHIDSRNIIFCNNKGLLDLDFLIDDGSHNIKAFKGIGLLYDAPWNRDYNTNLRFKSWLNIEDYFKNFIME